MSSAALVVSIVWIGAIAVLAVALVYAQLKRGSGRAQPAAVLPEPPAAPGNPAAVMEELRRYLDAREAATQRQFANQTIQQVIDAHRAEAMPAPPPPQPTPAVVPEPVEIDGAHLYRHNRRIDL
jgi:hypothetical protein